MVLTFAFIKLSIFDYSFAKLVTTKIHNNFRVATGFAVFGSFNFLDKLIGIGIGNQGAYVIRNLELFPWADNYFMLKPHILGFSSAISSIFINYGLLAGILFSIMFYKMYRYEDKSMRIFTYSRAALLQENKIHPTQKPVALYRWILRNFAKPGNKILDTHVGSGSSLVACKELGFDYWGFEIDSDYFIKAEERIKKSRRQFEMSLESKEDGEQMKIEI